MRKILCACLFGALFGVAAYCGIETDALAARAKIPYTSEDFGICAPADPKSVNRGWKYLLRYIQYEPETERVFSLVLINGEKRDQFLLALYTNVRLDQFDEGDEAAKLRLAVATKRIDQSFAQVLYRTWIHALLRSRYGIGARTAAARDYYYLSAYSAETGYMCADAFEFQKNTTTGRVVDIGWLVKNYLEEKDSRKALQIERQIRDRCANLR